MAGFRVLVASLGMLAIGVFGIHVTAEQAELAKEPVVVYAVLDRIVEEKHAVFLAENLQKEWVVPMTYIPNSRGAGDWFRLYLIKDEVESIEYDEQKTKEARKLARKRQKLLQTK